MIFGKSINRYYLKNIVYIILGIFALVVEDYLMLQAPRMYRMTVNGMNTGFVVDGGVTYAFDMDFLLNKICFPLIVFILLMALGRFFWRILFFSVSVRVEEDLRNRMFDRARYLSAQYYSSNKTGGLMSLFTNDLETVNECMGHGMVWAADAAIMGTLSVSKMWNMDPLLTVYCMIPMGILLAAAILVKRYMSEKWRVRQEAFSRLSDFTQERFSGISVIKAFVKEAVELVTFKKLNMENETANVKHTKASVLMRVLVTLFVQSVVSVILGYGGYQVYRGKFDAGQLVEFVGYFTSVVFPVMCISDLITLSSRGKSSLQRIEELLDAKQDVSDAPDAKSVEGIKGEIQFKNLTFRYPDGDRDVLKNISFTIEAGQKVGIVGRTGGGKTTVADILLRTYNVPDGTVFVDGQDVNTLKIYDLRQNFAYVPQDNFLFSDTIENNIAFGVETIEDAGVHRAAVLAAVDENIREFSKGYKTVLGERGVTVSGGQKQRLSIARALMKDAPVLIMDDSVSAVDTKTEKTILENMHLVRQNKTTILIAHRISTVEGMDKILFMDDGELIAQGSHEQLLENCPAYQVLVQLQKLEEEGGEEDA